MRAFFDLVDAAHPAVWFGIIAVVFIAFFVVASAARTPGSRD